MLRSLLLASFLLGLASVAIAAPAPTPATPVARHPGDAAAGRLMVFTCHGCHGIPGYRNAYPNYPVPKIAGQHYDYLVAALNEYRDGQRKPPTMTMNIQAKSLSEQDIRNIAAYLSSIRK